VNILLRGKTLKKQEEKSHAALLHWGKTPPGFLCHWGCRNVIDVEGVTLSYNYSHWEIASVHSVLYELPSLLMQRRRFVFDLEPFKVYCLLHRKHLLTLQPGKHLWFSLYYLLCMLDNSVFITTVSLLPTELFASGGKPLNRSPKPDTSNRAQMDESHSVLWEKPHGCIISRCQGCKCISHWGLFIFVFQTQISAHG